jgi:hypothetical protein
MFEQVISYKFYKLFWLFLDLKDLIFFAERFFKMNF